MNQLYSSPCRLVKVAASVVLCMIGLQFRAGAEEARPLDVIMVLDNSGSMRKNDGEGLMSKAVSAFAGKLSADSRLALVIFDQNVRVPLDLTQASTPDFAARIAQSLRDINYRGQRTDIPGGVERALYELREHGRPEAVHTLILFTDGMVDTGNAVKDGERTHWLQGSLAAEARDRGVRIFAVAFTEGADFQLMQSLAQTTGGEHYRVLAPADIAGTFDKILGRLQELNRRAAAPAAAPIERRSTPGPAVAQPPPTAAAPAILNASTLWIWLPGGLLLVIFVMLMVRRSSPQEKLPAVRLRDIGRNSGNAEIPLTKLVTRLGRKPIDTEVVLTSEQISSRHAEIEFRNGAFYLRDLMSSNGTYVNGRQISSPHEIREVPIKHRDRICFDACEFEFIVDGEVTVSGTVLSQPRVMEPARAGAPGLGTILKTGFCYRHRSHSAISKCGKCHRELCADCSQEVDMLPLCPDCRAVAT